MRYIVSIVCIVAVFSGCSLRENVLTLDSYEPGFTKISNAKSIQKAYIKSITDVRKNEALIGKVDNVANSYFLYSDTNIKLWLYKALEKGLKAHGYKIIDKPLREALFVKVAIMKFDIQYDKAVTNFNNLTGTMDIQLSLKKGFRKKIENITHKQSTFYENRPSKSQLKYLMQHLANDVISQILDKGTSL